MSVWMVAAVGIAVTSAAVTGVSSAMQADAQKQAANYNSQVAANNAKIALQQRSSSLQQGDVAAQQSQMHQAQVLGAQRASLAANGVDLTQGSAQDLLSSTKFLGAQDVNTIQSNAARTAWGYDVQGMNDSANSQLLKWQADNTNPAAIGAMAAGGSLLTSAGSFASMKAAK